MKSRFVECVFKVNVRKKISLKRMEKLIGELHRHFSKTPKVKRAKPLNQENPFLTLVFVGPKQSQLLNFRYRKKKYPTDVLSFSETSAHLGLGELVLCPSVLGKQAKRFKHSFKKELDYMVIHGFLHLLGYDHEKSRREELKMMALQDKLFSNLK